MILPPVPAGIAFPEDNVPEKEKLSTEFGRKAGRALYSRYFNGGTFFNFSHMSSMQEIRAYGNGDQSQQKYIDWYTNASSVGAPRGKKDNNESGNRNKGNRKGFANISYEIFSPMAKHSNILLATLADNDYKVQCQSLDKNAIHERLENKYKSFVDSRLLNPTLEELGLPTFYTPFNPKSLEELEVYDKMGFFKARQEAALEKLSELSFRVSDYPDQRRFLNKDAIDFHFRASQVYTCKSSKLVKHRYVDPANLVMIWNEQNQVVAIGEIVGVTVQSIFNELVKAGFTEEQIAGMAKEYQQYQTATNMSPWMFERKDSTTGRWLWMDFKVYVLKFEYLSTDYSYYFNQEIKGKEYYNKIRDINKFRKKNPDVQFDEHKCNYWYEGNYIISSNGQDMIYGWRKKPNQARRRNGSGELEPMCSYVFDRILGKAPTQRVISLLDDLQMAKLKLRAAVWAAAPKGYTMDVTTAANVTIGGQEYSPFDLINIHRQNGIRIMATKFNAAQGKYMAEIFRSEDNGIGPQGVEWLEQIAAIQNQILDTLGITDIMAASPSQSGERLVGVMEGDIEATNNAIWILKYSEQKFKQKLAERIVHEARINIEFDEEVEKAYRNIIGDTGIEALKEIEGLSLDSIGMAMKSQPTQKQKDGIMMVAERMAQTPTKSGDMKIKLSDLLRIRELLENGNEEEAIWYIAEAEINADKADKEHAERQQVVTAELQQQSALISEQAKQQTIMIESQAKIAQIEAQKNAEIEVLKYKYEFETPSKIAQIEAKSQGVKEEIMVEAAAEAQYGIEITGKV